MDSNHGPWLLALHVRGSIINCKWDVPWTRELKVWNYCQLEQVSRNWSWNSRVNLSTGTGSQFDSCLAQTIGAEAWKSRLASLSDFCGLVASRICLSSAIKTTTTFEEKAECNDNLFQVVSRSSFVLILDLEEQSCFDYDFQLRVVVAQIKTTTNICRTFASLWDFCFGFDFQPASRHCVDQEQQSLFWFWHWRLKRFDFGKIVGLLQVCQNLVKSVVLAWTFSCVDQNNNKASLFWLLTVDASRKLFDCGFN
jgi:hypothetical protein